MARTFITGAAGQDGILLARQLLARGDEVIGLVRTQAGADRLSRWVPGAQAVSGDVRDADRIRSILATHRVDSIAHLAGFSSPGASWNDPAEAFGVNAGGTVAILEAVRHAPDGVSIKIVNASSGEIFGAGQAPFDEAAPMAPTSPYSVAKEAAHRMVQLYRQAHGMHASNAILFNHESPLRPQRFVTRKITAGVAAIARGRQDRLLLGNLEVWRDWGWAPDYAAGIAAMLRADQPGDFVFATGVAHSLADFLAAAFARAGIDDWCEYVCTDQALIRPQDAARLVGNPAKAELTLGWTPTLTFDQLVAAMVDFDLAVIDSGDPDLVWS